MAVHELSREQARRIAVRAQLLDHRHGDEPRGGAIDVVRALTFVQNDVTSWVAPSADLVLWGRLGADYDPAELRDAVDRQQVIDLRGALRPVEDIALFRAEMDRLRDPDGLPGWLLHRCEWVAANDALRRAILDALRADGPLPAADLPSDAAVPWQSSGWNNHRDGTTMLEQLVHRGEIAVASGLSRDRLYDLAERVYPDDPVPDLATAQRIRSERRLACLGIARARGPEQFLEPFDVGGVGEPARVDGVRGTWRVDPALLDDEFDGRVVLLSPLDRLVFDRKRMTELFAFDYQLEMYKPEAKRRWGYWALPILVSDRLLGKVDAKAHRDERLLRVNAVHEDEPFPKRVRAEVDAQLEALAAWLGLRLERA